MLFSKGLVKIIRFHLQYLNFFSPYMYDIDPISYQLKFVAAKRVKCEMWARWIVFLLVTITLMFQTATYGSNFSSAARFDALLHIAAYQTWVIIFYVHYTKHDQTVELFNQLVKFEKTFDIGKNLKKSNLIILTFFSK
jgi:hypothetical protein